MNTKLKLPWMLSAMVALGQVAPATASMDSSMQALRDLFRAGDSAQAYSVADGMLQDFEGQAEFDFLYGASAIDQGHLKEGVFALERALLVEPSNDLIKLELARGYYLLGNGDEALELFDEVLASNPPVAVKQRIETYKERLSAQTTEASTSLTGFVEFWLGHDSNVNSGPGDQPGVVTLSAASLETDDQFFEIRTGLDFKTRYQIDKDLVVRARAQGRDHNDLSSQDFRQLGLSVEHGWLQSDREFRLGINLERYFLNGPAYRNLVGIYGQWNEQLTQQSILRTSLSYNRLNYPDIGYRDADQWMLSSTYLRSTPGYLNPTWYVGGFIGTATPDRSTVLSEAEVHRDFWGAQAGVQLNLSEAFSVTPGVLYQKINFEGEDWLYSKKREDEYYGPSLKAHWRINDSWSMNFSAAAMRNVSNMDLYDYDRQQYLVGTRFNF